MRRLAPFLLAIPLLLTGCAGHRSHPAIQTVIPPSCILGAMVTPGKTNCVGINKGEALCDGIVVKFACVKVNSKEKP